MEISYERELLSQ